MRSLPRNLSTLSDDVAASPASSVVEGCARSVTATIVGSLFCEQHEHFGDDQFDEQDYTT